MTEVFEFTGPEVIRLLLDELKRKGKVFPDQIGIKTTFHFTDRINHANNYIQLKIGDPVPGAMEI